MIASQAKVLASAGLSIFYLSIYLSDFTFVRQPDVASAVSAFEASGFRLSTVLNEGEEADGDDDSNT